MQWKQEALNLFHKQCLAIGRSAGALSTVAKNRTLAGLKSISCSGAGAGSDDDQIVSHDASRLGYYYHCVLDVIIYFTLSG